MKILLLTLIVCLSSLSGRRISDVRPLPELKTETSGDSIHAESNSYEIICDETPGTDLLGFSGFDKALTSNKESFFVTNRSKDILTEFTVQIIYRNIQGEMLHSRTVSVPVEIPPAETRRIDIASWDSQKQFYYHRTMPVPKRQATPFTVTVKLKKASFTCHDLKHELIGDGHGITSD